MAAPCWGVFSYQKCSALRSCMDRELWAGGSRAGHLQGSLCGHLGAWLRAPRWGRTGNQWVVQTGSVGYGQCFFQNSGLRLTKTAALYDSALWVLNCYSPFLKRKKKKKPHNIYKYGEWNPQTFSGKLGLGREKSDGELEIKSQNVNTKGKLKVVFLNT